LTDSFSYIGKGQKKRWYERDGLDEQTDRQTMSIRDAILMCARKPTRVSLIYSTEPTTKKCKDRKTKSRKQICSEITVNSLGNPCSESGRRKRKVCSGFVYLFELLNLRLVEEREDVGRGPLGALGLVRFLLSAFFLPLLPDVVPVLGRLR